MSLAATITSFPAIPLTTTFTRPEGCDGIYKPRPRTVYMVDDQPSCLPSGFATDKNTYFSPGIACPSGYWSACSDSRGVSTITTVTCCPVYGGDTSLSCHKSPETLGTRWKSLFCTWVAPMSGGVVAFTQSSLGPTGTEITTITPPGGLNAYGVRMLYQSTDLPTATSTSTSTLSTTELDFTERIAPGMATPTAPTTPQSTSHSEAAETASGPFAARSDGLTMAATVAIAVVIPVLVLLAALGFFLWWRARRALAAASKPQSPASEASYFPKEIPPCYTTAELSGGYIGVELSAVRAIQEMATSPIPKVQRGRCGGCDGTV